MTARTKNEWVKRLDGMHESCKEELKQVQRGQRVLSEFIVMPPGTPRKSVLPTPASTPTRTQQTLFDTTNISIHQTPPPKKRRHIPKLQPEKQLKQRTLFNSTQHFRHSKRIIEGKIIHEKLRDYEIKIKRN
jgi:hypothetical protein